MWVFRLTILRLSNKGENEIIKMESRYPIFPWTCWISLLAHAVILALFIIVTSNSGAETKTCPTVYQVQLVESDLDFGLADGGDGNGSGGGGGGRRATSNSADRKAPEKMMQTNAPAQMAATQSPPENTAHVAEPTKIETASLPSQPSPEQVSYHAKASNAEAANVGKVGALTGNVNGSEGGSGYGTGTGTGDGSGSGSGSGSGNGSFGRGNGEGDGGAPAWESVYRKAIYLKISRAKIYPYAARAARMEGKVVVRFIVNSSGELVSVTVLQNSPYSILNEDAARWIRRAAPFPAFPEAANRSSITFTYTLRYELKE